MTKLTEAQFAQVQDSLDNAMRASKRGTPERAVAEERSAKWDAAFNLPAVKAADREIRFAALAAVAAELGLA